MKHVWGQPTLTLPLSYTKRQDDIAAIVDYSVMLYFIYDGGEYVTTVNSERKRDNAIKNLKDAQVYAANLENQTSERIL